MKHMLNQMLNRIFLRASQASRGEATRKTRGVAHALALALCVVAAVPYAPDADAHGGRRFGYFIGGAVVGAAVFGPRYVYPAPVYYYPAPVVYPPTVTYVSPPPVVVQQAAPVVTQPVVPQVAAPPAQRLSIEERAQRLRNLCDQGLFTEQECRVRREQILQEM